MDTRHARHYLETLWADSILPTLSDYIRIPNVSPLFDPDWQAHGHMDEALMLLRDWAEAQPIRDMKVEIVRLPGRTPLLLLEIPGSGADTVLLYGHLDKQPPMEGWRQGLGPWRPVIENGRLYGRGGADDGYALFASLGAIAVLQQQGIPSSRCVILIEASEESGSPDLPAYIDALRDRLGTPELVICLDSGCGNYEQLWCTTSLRGLIGGTLSAGVLSEAVHSGDAGGTVPDSFRVLRVLLDRLEDSRSGRILPADFHSPIPPARLVQAVQVAAVLGDTSGDRFPLRAGLRLQGDSPLERVLNRSWRPCLGVIGADGLPPTAEAGNVQRTHTALRLSLRLPPDCDADRASAALKALLEADPPSGATVRFEPDWAASGWQAPDLAPWLERSLRDASQAVFGLPALHAGEGFSIPFMGMLGARFPSAQFVITGVLGPGSNAHGPNEFLHLDMARNLSLCVARVIADQYRSRDHQDA